MIQLAIGREFHNLIFYRIACVTPNWDETYKYGLQDNDNTLKFQKKNILASFLIVHFQALTVFTIDQWVEACPTFDRSKERKRLFLSSYVTYGFVVVTHINYMYISILIFFVTIISILNICDQMVRFVDFYE